MTRWRCLCFAGLVVVGPATADDAGLLATSAAAFRANRDAFPHLRLTHTYQVRSAANLEAFFALPPSDPKGRTVVRYVRRDGAVRFTVTESEESRQVLALKTPPTTRGPNGMVWGPTYESFPHSMLSNSGVTLTHQPRGRAAGLFAAEPPPHERPHCLPDRLADTFDFGAVATNALAGRFRYTCRMGGDRVVAEFRPLAEATATGNTTPVTRQVFELDPARGYLPTDYRKEFTAGGQMFVTVGRLSDLRTCSGGRWFPGRLQTANSPAKAAQSITGHDFIVTDLDANGRPTDVDLSVTLPAGTAVIDPARREVVTRREETIGPAELQGLMDRVAAVEPTHPSQPTARADLTDRRPRPWWQWAGYGVSGLLLASGVGLGIRRVVAGNRS